MFRLDNGVIVCKLAKLIEEQCHLTANNGYYNNMEHLSNQIKPNGSHKLSAHVTSNIDAHNLPVIILY